MSSGILGINHILRFLDSIGGLRALIIQSAAPINIKMKSMNPLTLILLRIEMRTHFILVNLLHHYMNIRQLGRVVMAQVSGIHKFPTCSKERGFESLSCQASSYSFSSTNFGKF